MAFQGREGPQLTIKQRSCLLRAARTQLGELHEEYEAAIIGLVLPTKLDVIGKEIDCVTAGIRWLWLQPAVDD